MSFLAPAIGPLIGGLGTAAASSLGGKLFGGGDNESGNSVAAARNFTPPGFTGGGLTATFGPTGLNVASGAGRSGLVGDIAATFPEQAALIAGQRASVTPGMSALRDSRLGEIESARQRAIGNLRDNLARRRVLGSSFAQDAISRGEAEFAQERERVAAETFLQELELTNQLVQQEFGVRRQEFTTKLDEMNLQAEIATKLTADATSTLGANARLEAELAAKEAEGRGKFFGQTFQPFFDQLGKGMGKVFDAPAPKPPVVFAPNNI